MTKPKHKAEVDPLTGGIGGSCHLWRQVDPEKEPELMKVGDDPIYQKVFGAMEQLRMEERKRCMEKAREFHAVSSTGKTFLLKYGHGQTIHLGHHKNAADYTFQTILSYWYDGQKGFNILFPINTEPYYH